MKKARIIAVIAALIVSLSGCANTDYPQAIPYSKPESLCSCCHRENGKRCGALICTFDIVSALGYDI